MEYKEIPTYANEMGVAVPGQILGTNEHVVLSKRGKEDIAFGAALFVDASHGDVVTAVNTGGTGVFAGIAQFVQNTSGYYPKNDVISTIRKGQVYVKVGEAVKAFGKVFVNKADGVYKASAGSSAAVEVDAVYLEDGKANALVPILVG